MDKHDAGQARDCEKAEAWPAIRKVRSVSGMPRREEYKIAGATSEPNRCRITYSPANSVQLIHHVSGSQVLVERDHCGRLVRSRSSMI